MFIVMLGAPGTGKGTIGGILEKELGIVRISSGDIFRTYVKKDKEIGKKIEDYMSKGLLVPDELVVQLVGNRLQESDVINGAILDGFPRTENQAKELDKLLSKGNNKVNLAINLSLPDNEVIARISRRRCCPNKECGEIYNLDFKPPIRDGLCDKCGSKLVQRQDDKEETIKRRLEVYHSTADELINYYKNQNVLKNIKLASETNLTSNDVGKVLVEELKATI